MVTEGGQEKFLVSWLQGRSDGVSRVSNAYGPTAEGGPPRGKFTLDIFEKLLKSKKITNFGRFAYGPTRTSLRLCLTFEIFFALWAKIGIFLKILNFDFQKTPDKFSFFCYAKTIYKIESFVWGLACFSISEKKTCQAFSKTKGRIVLRSFLSHVLFLGHFLQKIERKKGEIPDVFHNFCSSFVEPQVGFSIVQFFQKLQNPDRNKIQNLKFLTAFGNHYFAHCFSLSASFWAEFRHLFISVLAPAMVNPRLFSTLLNITILLTLPLC